MSKAVFVLPFIIVCLLTAIWSGWIRIGFDLPVTEVAAHHGSLMVNGFLASLIFMERAVTFRNKLVLLLPFLNVVSIILQVFNIPYASYLQVGCNVGFIMMCGYFITRYKELYYYVFFAAALCLTAGNIELHNTHLYPAAVTWWILFLLLTIVAERLELTRFLPVNNFKQWLLISILGLLLLSSFLPFHQYGHIAFAVMIIFTALWLMKYDMAFKSIKAKGQHRYSGLLLITGYGWLIITGFFSLSRGNFLFGYDALLHSFFIGFVFSMIFSHAPVILPAVAKLPIKIYTPVLYLWFILLQLSLIVRIIADIFNDAACRKYAGLANGIAILLFFINIGVMVRKGLIKRWPMSH